MVAADWLEALASQDPYQTFSKFVQKISNAFDDLYSSCKSSNFKAKLNPWFDKDFKMLQKDKQKAYFEFLMLRDSSSKTAYNRIKNHFERVIKFKELTFYKLKLIKNQTNIRALWKILNYLIGKCIPQHSLLICDPLTNDVIKELFEVAEAFNNYFFNIQKKLGDTNDFQVEHKSNKIDQAQFTTKRSAK